jgi:hypothetical protein
MADHNFKVSVLARCVSAVNAVCKDIDIFNKDYISLTDILKHCLYLDLPYFYFSIFSGFHTVH